LQNRSHALLFGATATAIAALAGCTGSAVPAIGAPPAQTAQAAASRAVSSSQKPPFGKLVRHGPAPHAASWLSREAQTGPVVYVADFGDNVVDIYSRTTQALVGQLATGISAPYGVTTTADGKIYVAEQDFTNVAIFNRHSTRPILVLMDTQSPYAVAVAPDGTVYATLLGGGVDVFAKGNSFPSYTIEDPSFAQMWGLALDRSGNLYVGGQSETGGGQVSVFPAGSHGPGTNLNLKGLGLPTTLAFMPNGALLVGDYDLSTIDVYPAGRTAHSLQVHANNVAYVAHQPNVKTIWAPAYGGTAVSIVELPSGKSSSIQVAGSAVQLTGVAFSVAP
jgi:DNA-binding beta-propeller fold protein YncE